MLKVDLIYQTSELFQDVFHWQIMDGNLTQNIQKYLPLIGE